MPSGRISDEAVRYSIAFSSAESTCADRQVRAGERAGDVEKAHGAAGIRPSLFVSRLRSTFSAQVAHVALHDLEVALSSVSPSDQRLQDSWHVDRTVGPKSTIGSPTGSRPSSRGKSNSHRD